MINDYDEYGIEWERSVSKLSKKDIISILKDSLVDLNKINNNNQSYYAIADYDNNLAYTSMSGYEEFELDTFKRNDQETECIYTSPTKEMALESLNGLSNIYSPSTTNVSHKYKDKCRVVKINIEIEEVD